MGSSPSWILLARCSRGRPARIRHRERLVDIGIEGWFILIGFTMLCIGFLAPSMRRVPLTPAIVYLAVGVILGPTLLSVFHFNPLRQSELLELLTELAVLVALFAAGIKMPAPVSWKRWRTPFLLAFLSMAVTVALIAAFGYWFLGLPLGLAVLLGAILAPTDPVLASDIQVRYTDDRDRLRFNLTCEAGMNDGTAFPFAMLGLGLLGLHELGPGGSRWLLVDVAWAGVGGVLIGVAAGVVFAWALHFLRRGRPDATGYEDFLGLGMIGVVFGLCLWVDAGGFLAVFFAAVALRQTEMRLAGQHSLEQEEPVTQLVPQVGVGALVYKEHLERLSELVLVILLGGMLFVDSWSWRAVALALFVFFVARPVSVFVGLGMTRTPMRMRAMVGWFGVRGIGSLFYLMFAINQGLDQEMALELLHLTLVVVTLSIVLHGLSAKPLMMRFWRRSAQAAIDDPGRDRPATASVG
ncbi:sodium:proton antiporter [Azoarcus taiwanensis]|uniref:Sodium:proton antiporter n=1 Tax=Azoarcus taiwanensis TaxID=666964 RepID=A0A972FAQ9_9RHOO|nr:cation:proton antiporter [Azoarcus taiwanensis]NMG05045.1 sodium:proton antiporter [Azoarcus taiwanensis]